jgi:hypothetical protein
MGVKSPIFELPLQCKNCLTAPRNKSRIVLQISCKPYGNTHRQIDNLPSKGNVFRKKTRHCGENSTLVEKYKRKEKKPKITFEKSVRPRARQSVRKHAHRTAR